MISRPPMGVLFLFFMSFFLLNNCKNFLLKNEKFISDYPVYPDKLSLKAIRISPQKDEKFIEVKEDKSGKPYFIVEIKDKESGFHLVEEIQKGRILEHSLIIRNSRGEILIKKPLLIHEVQKQNSSSSPLKLSFRDSTLPQLISLKKLPEHESFISAYIELTYLQPFMAEVCDKNRDPNETPCPDIQTQIFSGIQKDIQEKEGSLQKKLNLFVDKNPWLTKATEEEKLKFLEENIKLENEKKKEYYTSRMRVDLERLNPAPPKEGESKPGGQVNFPSGLQGSRFYYREWKLTSEPNFIELKLAKNILSRLEAQKPKPQVATAPPVQDNGGTPYSRAITPSPYKPTNQKSQAPAHLPGIETGERKVISLRPAGSASEIKISIPRVKHLAPYKTGAHLNQKK